MLFNITIRFVRVINYLDCHDRVGIVHVFRRNSMNESQLQKVLDIVVDQLVEKPDDYSIIGRKEDEVGFTLDRGKDPNGGICGYFLLHYISRSFSSSVDALKWARGITKNIELDCFEVFIDIHEIRGESISKVEELIKKEIESEVRKKFEETIKNRVVEEERKKLSEKLEPEIRRVLQSVFNSELKKKRATELEGIDREKNKIQEEIQSLSRKLEEQKSYECSLSRVECNTTSNVKISGSESDLRLYALVIFSPKKLNEQQSLGICQDFELLFGSETIITQKGKDILKRSKLVALYKLGKLNIQFYYWRESDGIPLELKNHFSQALGDAKSIIKQIDTLISTYDS